MKGGGFWGQRRNRQLALIACFLLPSLAIFFLYRILPLGWNVLLSFEFWSPLKPAQWAGFEHYVEMWSYDDVFWVALRNTLIFIAASPLAIAVSLGIALLVNSDLKGASVYRTIVFLSYPLMTVAVGIIWRWMYDERGGIINYALRASGLVDRPVGFLQDFDWALPSVIFAGIWQVLGFYMIILLTGLQSIPQHLYEAARVDGATRWQQFRAITLPSLKPALVPAVILSVVWTFNMFNIIFLVTAGQPAGSTEILITQSYKFAFQKYQYGYAAAYSTVIFGILLIYGVFQNRMTKGTEAI